MAFQVVLADSAKADADRVCQWVTSEAPLHGPKWFEELVVSVYSLERLPFRCPLAREAELAKREIRCLLFGNHRGVCRILYEVDRKRRTVWDPPHSPWRSPRPRAGRTDPIAG